MNPIAWELTCTRAHCNDYRPRVLRVDGDKKTATAAARAKGWRPCHEVLNDESRSYAHWYCPTCIAEIAELAVVTRA